MRNCFPLTHCYLYGLSYCVIWQTCLFCILCSNVANFFIQSLLQLKSRTLELTLSVIPVGLPAHIFHTLNAHTNVEHYICRVCVYAILAKQKSKEHTHTCFQV